MILFIKEQFLTSSLFSIIILFSTPSLPPHLLVVSSEQSEVAALSGNDRKKPLRRVEMRLVS